MNYMSEEKDEPDAEPKREGDLWVMTTRAPTGTLLKGIGATPEEARERHHEACRSLQRPELP
jgi:hypothetical protein